MEEVSRVLTWLTSPFYGEPAESIDFQTFLQEAKTGDMLLLASHTSGQLFQRFFTLSRYSHVAMAIRDESGKLWIWHSSVHCKQADILTGTRHDGVQLSDAAVMLPGYLSNGGYLISYRRLFPHPAPNGEEMQRRLVAHVMRPTAGMGYEGNILKLVSAYYDQIHHTPFGDLAPPCDRELFCSELVALSFMAMGIIDTARPFDEYAPVDFTETWESMPLLAPYHYGKEIKIVF